MSNKVIISFQYRLKLIRMWDKVADKFPSNSKESAILHEVAKKLVSPMITLGESRIVAQMLYSLNR